MLGGFNHNIRHQSRIFHVQTEDLGLPSAQIRSHIFFNGMVVAESGQSYQDLMRFDMTPDQRVSQIRNRMQGLHKNSLKLLVQGAYDRVIQQRLQTTQSPAQAMPSAPPSAAVDDPELTALLNQVQTSRPSAEQARPNFHNQTVPAQPATAAPTVVEEKKSTETAKTTKPEKIPGRAARLFPKREKKEELVNEQEVQASAKLSRSESSMVKNRKKPKSKEQKEEEEKDRATDAARSRGINTKKKKIEATKEKQDTPTKADTSSGIVTAKPAPPTQPQQIQNSAVPTQPPHTVPTQPPHTVPTQPPRAVPTQPPRAVPTQPPHLVPPVARPMPPNHASAIPQRMVPMTNRPGTGNNYPRPRTNPPVPSQSSAYPLQPLPSRGPRPVTPGGSRPPVAIPTARPGVHRPPVASPRSYPPGPAGPPGPMMPPYPGPGHKPR